jgi:hypothetical protein
MRIITVIQFNYTNITINAMQQQCVQSEIQHEMHSSFKSSNQSNYNIYKHRYLVLFNKPQNKSRKPPHLVM